MNRKLVTVYCDCGAVYRTFNKKLVLECPKCFYRCSMTREDSYDEPINVVRNMKIYDSQKKMREMYREVK